MGFFQLFDKIRTEHPGVAESKIIPVSGDLSEIRLGMSDDDYNMLVRNVSVVFHVAATVRFDEPIRDAIIKNVRGTREVVGLAAQMKNLRVSKNFPVITYVYTYNIYYPKSARIRTVAKRGQARKSKPNPGLVVTEMLYFTVYGRSW